MGTKEWEEENEMKRVEAVWLGLIVLTENIGWCEKFECGFILLSPFFCQIIGQPLVIGQTDDN
jgi:hypothetical protein